MNLRLDLVKQLLPKRKETKGVSRSAPPGGETVQATGSRKYQARRQKKADRISLRDDLFEASRADAVGVFWVEQIPAR